MPSSDEVADALEEVISRIESELARRDSAGTADEASLEQMSGDELERHLMNMGWPDLERLLGSMDASQLRDLEEKLNIPSSFEVADALAEVLARVESERERREAAGPQVGDVTRALSPARDIGEAAQEI